MKFFSFQSRLLAMLLLCVPALAAVAVTQPNEKIDAGWILEQSNAALGGADAIRSKKTYSLRLRFEEDDKQYTGYVWGRPPYDYRLEIHLPGIRGPVFTESSNGEIVWHIALTEDGPRFTEEEWAYRPAFDFYGPTLDYKEKNIDYQFTGTSDFEGTAAYTLVVTYPKGDTESVYFARGSFLPLGYEKEALMDEQMERVRTVIAEYEVIDDLLVGSRMVDYVNGNSQRIVILESLDFDQTLPDYLFQPPADAARWK